MFRWVSRESFEGKISGDKFSTVSACWGLFANAMLATSGNNAFSPLNIIYFTLPWLRKGKISKGSEIAQDMNTVFASGKLFTELWWVSRILEEGSQERRLKLNKSSGKWGGSSPPTFLGEWLKVKVSFRGRGLVSMLIGISHILESG